ncbi:MAG: glycoside hydrolase [Chitinophagaceae bacterium]|jgi:hypothetical protein|nr:glycoside hydrolase [Chitinophagaceae bacterium]
MKSLIIALLTGVFIFHAGTDAQGQSNFAVLQIGTGEVPNIAIDKQGTIHIIYGNGDSIMYAFSSDHGKNFSTPKLIASLQGLFSFAMRGPQIACTADAVVVTACTQSGDIYAFRKQANGNWTKTVRLNNIAGAAKEGMMALDAAQKNIFAVWLDSRYGHNQVYGARSADGGKTWQKNQLIYKSPDTVVCSCCKPAVAVKENNVYVMFRNWLNGSRDLYLASSNNAGKSFQKVEKLGKGTWKLNGCPMDGGGLAINYKGDVSTVWRRENKIYSCMPGHQETEIDEGRNCSIAYSGVRKIFAFTKEGEVIIRDRNKITNPGKGSLPVVKTIDANSVLCVWENEKQILGVVVNL